MNKPPYHIPSMREIQRLPWNGFKVASLFSGCGGSCLGYRMAGFRVVWANEFVPSAQESYRANMGRGCILDCRDLRQVKPGDILKALCMKKGELDLLDGSPPCQAFSFAGARHTGWNKERRYDNGKRQCDELLFDEYVRILRGLMPKAFIAENVSGLAKGTAKGFFLEILRKLKRSGYRVRCKMLDAQWLGVPQMRARIVFVGIRNDLEILPAFPRPLSYKYTTRDALSHIERIQTGSYASEWRDSNRPMCVIVARDGNRPDRAQCADKNGIRKFTIQEVKRLCSFPRDFRLSGSYVQQWERLGNAVPPIMMSHVAAVVRNQLQSIERN